MRKRSVCLVLLAMVGVSGLQAQDTPSTEPVTTLALLMQKLIQPYSDAVFYIGRTPPGSEADWLALEAKTLALAESGNLMMLPGYALDQGQWLRESRLLRDAGLRAFEAARARDTEALAELNNELYTSCESCHEAYR